MISPSQNKLYAIVVLLMVSSCMVNQEVRPARYAEEAILEDSDPTVIEVEDVPKSRDINKVRELRNENYILETASCDEQGKFDFTLKNIGDRLVPIEGGDPPADQGKAIRLFVNGFPISNLQDYCGDSDLSPGSKAFCEFQPKGSKDAFIKIVQPPKVNIIQVKQQDYSASMQLRCGADDENYVIREIRCSRNPDTVLFNLGNIFDKDMSLDNIADAVRVSVNGFELTHLSDYCSRRNLAPGDDIDCKRSEHSPFDRGVKLFTGNTAQNTMAIRYGAYTQSLTFACS